MSISGTVWLYFGVLVLTIVQTDSVYLPGLSPINYCVKEESVNEKCKSEIPVFVNKLTSRRSLVSLSYDSLDFCTPSAADAPVENLGQVVFGERLQRSTYAINFAVTQTCTVLCERTYSDANPNLYYKLRKAIEMHYYYHFVVDNLPVTVCLVSGENKRYCSTSIPLGCFGSPVELEDGVCQGFDHDVKSAVLLNHAHFTISYHSAKDSWSGKIANRIVSVTVEPRSIDHPKVPDCTVQTPLVLPDKVPVLLKVLYTYSVGFVQTADIKWASRWDYILETMPQSNIQWPSILNSVVLVILLSALAAVILLRTLRRDFARYSQMENSTEVQEESGWKLVHGDVFRPPTGCMLLSVMVGSGSQIFIMTLVTLFFACLGFLSPANRGALMSCALVMYVLSGIFAGYAAARMYKFMGGVFWKINVLLTATVCPGVVFVIFFVLNIALWALQSATAVPFGTIMALVALWLCVSLPLCYVGAYCGFRKVSIDVPVRTNQIPRQIPFLTSVNRPSFNFFVGGLVPFSCVFIQLFFIFNSIWGTQFYFMFGLLFVVFVMLVIASAEFAILMTYYQLCREDYRWWWRSFYSAAGTSFYLTIYSLHYFIARLEYKDAISVFLYFGYISIVVWLSFLFVGTVGFFACLWFIRKIYSVVKVD